MTILSKLPPEHPARNRQLRDIHAEVRNLKATDWRKVAAWKIGTNTYNELGTVWTELCEFRAPTGDIQ